MPPRIPEIKAAEKALKAVKNWQRVPMPDAPAEMKARAFRGSANGWTFLVVSFSIEDQGFPAGSRGYDGTATRPMMVMHLPRDLAERGYKLAAKQTSGLNGLPVQNGDAEDRAAYRLVQLAEQGVKGVLLMRRRDGSLAIRFPNGDIEEV